MSIGIGSNHYEVAMKKLDVTPKGLNRYESAVCDPVRDCLKDFCSQNDEFAQAVAQGGTFKDCLSACTKGIGQSCSDLEVYKRAVQFYFKGADVHMELKIDLGDAGFSDNKSIGLSLDSLLDF
ncbi:MAG: hypothetical protein IKH78_08215 [Ruminococcus sp.]|nr:hypothetical protein [Ruminococcus sp.]